MTADTSNFFSQLFTSRSRKEVAELFRSQATLVRKCGWEEYEVRFPWGELVIEAANPILMHGPIDDVLTHSETLFRILEAARIAYSGECYGSDGTIIREFKWVPE